MHALVSCGPYHQYHLIKFSFYPTLEEKLAFGIVMFAFGNLKGLGLKFRAGRA